MSMRKTEPQILFRPREPDFTRVAAEPDWEALSRSLPAATIDRARQSYEQIVDIWAGLFALPQAQLQRVCDTEDWVENAVQLVAALETGFPVHVIDPGADRNGAVDDPAWLARSFLGECYMGEPATDRFGARSDFDPRRPTVFRGMMLRYDPLFPPLAHGEKAPVNLAWPPGGRLHNGEAYWREPVLVEALGRRAIVSSGDSSIDPASAQRYAIRDPMGQNHLAQAHLEQETPREAGPLSYVDATRRLVAAGAGSLIAKIVFQAKYQPPTPLDMDMRELRMALAAGDDGRFSRLVSDAFFKAFDVNLLDCEGRPECFLIQEHIPMLSEYWIAVIGGRPVAGAGCIECLSPLFHEPDLALRGPDGDGAFDVKVEGKRGDGMIRHDPELVAAYVDTAWRLCEKLNEAAGSDGRANPYADCVMDFAWNDDSQEIVLVETNPPDNFGLYAMDISPVTKAIVDRAIGGKPEAVMRADIASSVQQEDQGRDDPAPGM